MYSRVDKTLLLRNSFCGLALLALPGLVSAFDIGFKSEFAVDASDNVGAQNAGEEEGGSAAYGEFAVFGIHETNRLDAGFNGEILTVRHFGAEPNEQESTITKFMGAAEYQITPRSLSWYAGNIMGSVRGSDALQPIDEFQDTRRNVFATGPALEYRTSSFSTLKTRFLYVTQYQDGENLPTIYNTQASWNYNAAAGNVWGVRLSDVYTDNPVEILESDINRLSLVGTWSRQRGDQQYSAQLGGTRYTTVIDQVLGLNLQVKAARGFGERNTVSIVLGQDLREQSINTVERILSDGSSFTPDGDGFFDQTKLEVILDQNSVGSNINLKVGVSQADYRLLSNDAELGARGNLLDKVNLNAAARYSKAITERTNLSASVSYQEQEFDNRDDSSSSLLTFVEVSHRLTRSVELNAGYKSRNGSGSRAVFFNGNNIGNELTDKTENRFTIGVRWAPPTRASQALTVQLKSLL